MTSIKPTAPQLYEKDYYAWVQDQVRALRGHRTEEVDWENVAEEIDDLGKSVGWSVEKPSGDPRRTFAEARLYTRNEQNAQR
jgi:hypothetical protein